MDKRLARGRERVQAGEEAIRAGETERAREEFLEAMLLFRGPELRIGEAHSLRGLARVDLAHGQAERAEMQVRESISIYGRVREQLARLTDEELVAGFRHDADEGEALSYVLLGEILVALGQHGNARVAFEKSKRNFSALGDVSSSAVMWASMGRLYMRDGQYELAQAHLATALSRYVASADLGSQANVLLSLAELNRLRQSFDTASDDLRRVSELARTIGDKQLEGRAVSALGALNLQLLDLDASHENYERALRLAKECGDHKMESYSHIGLGEVKSRAGDATALLSIVKGAQGFAHLGHEHGMGASMLRLAEHAMRSGRPVLALVAAESGRRLWRRSDPVRGVGQALRIVVKALAAIKRWEAVLTVAKARVVIAGELQPNAGEVFAFYEEKAPKEWLEKLGRHDNRELVHLAEETISSTISSLLTSAVVVPSELGTILGSMATIERILTGDAEGEAAASDSAYGHEMEEKA